MQGLYGRLPGRFNPRSRAGSDLQGLAEHNIVAQSFNPRSRAGSDLVRHVNYAAGIPFQSTLPRGERHQTPQKVYQPTNVSIHAPARGATPTNYTPLRIQSCFNPRSRAGSDAEKHAG